MGRALYIRDDIPLEPERRTARYLGYGGRVGGRYLLRIGNDPNAELTWECVKPATEANTHDTYECLADDVDTSKADAIDEAVRLLPDGLRVCVEMVFFAGMTQREAARAIGVDHRTVGRRLQKAAVVLRDTLAGFDHEEAASE